MRITRKIEFDAGHRLIGHESKCAHLHGHRYVAEITVEAPGLDKVGRVVDFSVIKDKVGGWIDEHWDHNMLLNKEDPLLDMPPTSTIWNGKPPYIFDCNPTAENMAEVLSTTARTLLDKGPLIVVHIRLYETPNCWVDLGD